MALDVELLRKRLQEVEDKQWYLELFGEAYDRNNGDTKGAISDADELYEQAHKPAADEDDETMRKVSDALALHDYIEGQKDEEAEGAETTSQAD